MDRGKLGHGRVNLATALLKPRHRFVDEYETPKCEKGDKIGMLLDLDKGSLAVYRNDQRLGLIVPSGLKGPLRWTVGVGNGCGAPEDQAISVSSKAPPVVSPEELTKDLDMWSRGSFKETQERLVAHSNGEWTDDY